MVGIVEDDQIFAPGIGACQAQRQFVGFTAAVHQIRQRSAMQASSLRPLDIARQQRMQIASVGVQQGYIWRCAARTTCGCASVQRAVRC